ncbi:hypothetical protein Nepgr_004112 [Nepenthes gracilis]|uniref:Glycosyltransferase n=1 Tax=Nepenthes gracilis TaxID=150966 RepID=A0AAD3S0R2_NEPGR|nr:hypothetical protein Nepgr_004112 [Nepenthes gracilis]
MAGGEIVVLPFFGQGHLFPCIELCNHLSSRNFKITLVISAALSSSIPSSLRSQPLVQIAEIQADAPPPPPPETLGGPPPQSAGPDPFHKQHDQIGLGIESLLSARPDGSPRHVCAIVDVMMSWSKDVLKKFDVPVVAFFTSGACSAAIEYAAWKGRVDDMQPGEMRVLPGLPEDMAISYWELKRRPRRPPPGFPGSQLGPPPPGHGFPPGGVRMRPFGGGFKGPPGPGQQPPWVDEVDGTVAIMMNTSQDLEGPFLEYVANQIGKPVWGVGPLLPEEYWKSASSILHDRMIRPKKKSDRTEEEVMQWLDSKPRGSVVYVSFGSEVGPTREEYGELAGALEESGRPFIWVIQLHLGREGPPGSGLDGGYYPHGLQGRVGERGLIIHGWAPQLLILSHPATGGFLSHCGWNSIAEALGRGVPILGWPIRGDQFYNAKLVVSHLRLGYMVLDRELSEMVTKEDIAKGIDRLMGDEGIKQRAASLKLQLVGGGSVGCFPRTSEDSLNAFRDFVCSRLAA